MRRRGSAAEAADALTRETLAAALARLCRSRLQFGAAAAPGSASLAAVSADEATIEETDEGAVVASPGWFVLNAAEMAWMRDDKGGEWMDFGRPEGEFEQYGIGVHVLWPGQVNGLYHSESVQEDFLVLSGECLLLVEEEERRLKAWDFVHFAPGTRHIYIGAGAGPCAILMVGARRPRKDVALPGHGAGAEARRRRARGDRRPEAGLPRVATQLPARPRHLARLAHLRTFGTWTSTCCSLRTTPRFARWRRSASNRPDCA